MTPRIPVAVFFGLFTVSGFAGLIYQSIWSHYLKLFLGHAAYAQTLVLAIFMGGMALGAWIVGQNTHRLADLLRGYALAELGIGILALVFHRVFLATTGWAFDTVLPALGGTGVDAFKWSLASLLILPASMLLGTTFPLMSAGVLRQYPDVGGRALSMLYFTNSFGAALGVLASGFILIDHVGLPGTILVAGVMNVLLALAVWILASVMPRAGVPPPPSREAASGLSRLARTVLLLAFVTGAASFVYEITWIRMLTLVLGASTHSFEIMLAAFILGMAAGAFWFRNRISGLRDDIRWLAGLLLAKAAFAVAALHVYGNVIDLVHWFMQSTSRSDGGYVLTTLVGMAASILVMFPAAFCAGMTLPLATHVLTSRGLGEASIGRVYAANTAGCILGATFATHLGMELAGVRGLTAIGALLDAGIGIAVFLVAGNSLRSAPAIAGAALAAAGVALFATSQLDLLKMSSGIFRHGQFVTPELGRLAFYRDGKTATISVIDLGSLRSIRTNGKPDASIEMLAGRPAAPDEYTMVLAAALPLAHKPDIESVANIGFGSGLTTHALLGSARIREVDSIEIERAMVEGARLYAPRNDRAFNDPRSRIFIEDAKTFFAARGKRYDLIVSEPSNPWVSGTSTLFSREFYAQARRHLKDDGLLMQWIQFYEINVGLLSTVFRALGEEFGDYVVYRTESDLLVIASPRDRIPEPRADLLSFPALGADLAFLGIRGLDDLKAARVGGRRALEPLFLRTGYPANSDFFPILDQRAPRARFKGESASELASLRHDLSSVLAMLEGETRLAVKDLPATGNAITGIGHARLGAAALSVALHGGASAMTRLQGRARAEALLVHALLDQCEGAGADFVNALAYVSRLAVPFLRAEEAGALLRHVRASRCFRSLDATQHQRIELLEALNRRDAGAVSRGVEAVLSQALDGQPAVGIDPQDLAELLAAGVAASLVEGRADRARALRDRFLPRIAPPGSDVPMPLQLALAHLSAAGNPR